MKAIGGLFTVFLAALMVGFYIDAGQQKGEDMFDNYASGFRQYLVFFIIALLLTIFAC